MQAALDFHDVRKEYRRWNGQHSTALDGLSLRVEPGEIFGFLGANGAGKTTAIHLALGFLRPTSGTGQLLGHPFGHAATRARVGFLGENVALYPRKAAALLEFYGALNGLRQPQLQRRVREVLIAVDLLSRQNENVKRFSRGMQQRIGLAQALINEPEILILDEPTSALDPFSRIAVRELLLEQRNLGRTVFLSSHLLSEIEQVCDRVAILRKGRVARIGTLAEVLAADGTFDILARGISGAAFPHAAISADGFTITVSAADQRRVIESIWSSGGEIVSVTPNRQSLEELFVNVAADAPEDGTREDRP